MTFESETDTEVIPKLCMYVYNNLTEPLAFSEVRVMLWPSRTCSHHISLVCVAFQNCCCNPGLYSIVNSDGLVLQLIMEVMTQLEGAYALLIKSSHYPGELVACKRGSPLILGIKETPVHSMKRTSSSLISDLKDIRKRPAGEAFEAFVASDASAVVEHTKRCSYSSIALIPCTALVPHFPSSASCHAFMQIVEPCPCCGIFCQNHIHGYLHVTAE